ncbi:hypothetical protein DID73_01390 [Candidatus Marinamargulisbacteria bacterium SCGC AG-343-K17]|nr:hypothetical protein DID73_01390 [Candidatus Marinamargulisbacteria bacterium SCGC AG-343-K17]
MSKKVLLAAAATIPMRSGHGQPYGPTAKSVDPTQGKLQFNCGKKHTSKDIYETNGQINIGHVNDFCDADPDLLGLKTSYSRKIIDVLLSGYRLESNMDNPNPSATLAFNPKKIAFQESKKVQDIRNQTSANSILPKEVAVFWGGCFDKDPEILPINRQRVITNETNALGNREEVSSTYMTVDHQSIMKTKQDCAELMPYQKPGNPQQTQDDVYYVILAAKLFKESHELIGVMIAIPPRSFLKETWIGVGSTFALTILYVILRCCWEDNRHSRELAADPTLQDQGEGDIELEELERGQTNQERDAVEGAPDADEGAPDADEEAPDWPSVEELAEIQNPRASDADSDEERDQIGIEIQQAPDWPSEEEASDADEGAPDAEFNKE